MQRNSTDHKQARRLAPPAAWSNIGNVYQVKILSSGKSVHRYETGYLFIFRNQRLFLWIPTCPFGSLRRSQTTAVSRMWSCVVMHLTLALQWSFPDPGLHWLDS